MAERIRRFTQRAIEELRLFGLDQGRRILTSHVEQTEARRKTAAEFRTAAIHFVRIKMKDSPVARARILKWYDDALADRDKHPLQENRIANMLAIMYASGENDEERLKDFTELGESGNLNRELNFQESQRFFIAWLLTKKVAGDAWGFLTGKFGQAKDFAGRHPVDFQGLLDETLRHRGEAQGWMRGYAETHRGPTPTGLSRQDHSARNAWIIIGVGCLLAIIFALIAS